MSEYCSFGSRTPLPAALRFAEREHSRGVMQKILVVIDDVKGAGRCIEKASRIAASCGSAIEFYVRDVEIELPGSWAGGYRSEEFRNVLRQRKTQELEEHLSASRQSGLNVNVVLEWTIRNPGDVADWAVRSKPDLVVCPRRAGTKDQGELNPFELELLHNAVAPLLWVSHATWRDHPMISAAVDPCHPAERPVVLDQEIFSKACSLAASLAGGVEVLHVLEGAPHFPGEAISKNIQVEADARAREAVQAVVRPHGATTPDIRFKAGHMPAGIVEMLQEHVPDILVVGSAARHRHPHARISTTVSEVLGRATCDVMVVKPPGFVSPLLVSHA